jgi:glycosyltransferase involved in cell wall biosynthesis
MIPELYPELFPFGNPHMEKRAFVDAADVIFCISAATMQDLFHLYGQPDAPVVVTPLGVDARFRPDVPPVSGLPAHYVLFIGNRGGYKDFGVLAQAFAHCGFPDDVKLIAAGGGAFSPEEEESLRRLGLSTQVTRVDLADAELPGAYAHALCFVFPSRYEGFGLPTLEAMASGCPTILVSSSSHPEVGGDAALYFPPGDADGLSRLMMELVASPERRAERRAAGLERAADYSWRHTARRTVEGYHEAGVAQP